MDKHIKGEQKVGRRDLLAPPVFLTIPDQVSGRIFAPLPEYTPEAISEGSTADQEGLHRGSRPEGATGCGIAWTIQPRRLLSKLPCLISFAENEFHSSVRVGLPCFQSLPVILVSLYAVASFHGYYFVYPNAWA